jgi:CRP/FNR family transcriptional regulator, cyclic AMP receptor protein
MNALRTSFGLDHLAPEHHERLEECARRLRVAAGESLYGHGEAGRDPYFVEEGEVALRRTTVYGGFVLQRVGAPGLFGELGLLDGGPRPSEATAAVDTELLSIDAERLLRLAARDPAFAVAIHWALWRNLARQLRELNSRLARFSPGDQAPAEAAPRAQPAVHEAPVEDRRSLLRELGLSNMEVNYLASLSRLLELQPGQALFTEGEMPGHVYVVHSGRVMISQLLPGSGVEALAFLGRGELFGEMAVIEQAPRSARASADDEGALVLEIRREVLDKLLDPHRASSIRLLQVACRQLAARLRESQEKLIGWFILAGGHQQAGLLAEP